MYKVEGIKQNTKEWLDLRKQYRTAPQAAIVVEGIQQNTKEWMDLRKQYRTASQAAIVMGISPFQSAYNFKLQQAGLKTTYYSDAMKLGHEKESEIREWASDQLGLEFTEQIWINEPYLASLDGAFGGVIIEIKTSDKTYESLKNGVIEPHYMAQMQQQLYCSHGDEAYLVAYSPTLDEYIMSDAVTYDEKWMQAIEKAWEEFEKIEIPEKIDFSDDGEIVNLFNTYEAMKAKQDELKERMEKVKEELIKRSQGHSISANGHSLARGKARETINYAQACKDAGIDLSDYKKTSSEPSWSIKLKKNVFERYE